MAFGSIRAIVLVRVSLSKYHKLGAPWSHAGASPLVAQDRQAPLLQPRLRPSRLRSRWITPAGLTA